MIKIEETKVVEILKQCYDPELPVDLWNLGLIYDIQIQEAYDENKSDINIVMSLTTPGCTMGDQIAQDIRRRMDIAQLAWFNPDRGQPDSRACSVGRQTGFWGPFLD